MFINRLSLSLATALLIAVPFAVPTALGQGLDDRYGPDPAVMTLGSNDLDGWSPVDSSRNELMVGGAGGQTYSNGYLTTLQTPESNGGNQVLSVNTKVFESSDMAASYFKYFTSSGSDQHDNQTVQALCLNLVTNAVITWNTVYMTRVLDALRADGVSVNDEDLAHLAPTLRAHINPYGKYSFDVDSGLARTAFRPLREPPIAASA
jgi:hypothetical protein